MAERKSSSGRSIVHLSLFKLSTTAKDKRARNAKSEPTKTHGRRARIFLSPLNSMWRPSPPSLCPATRSSGAYVASPSQREWQASFLFCFFSPLSHLEKRCICTNRQNTLGWWANIFGKHSGRFYRALSVFPLLILFTSSSWCIYYHSRNRSCSQPPPSFTCLVLSHIAYGMP